MNNERQRWQKLAGITPTNNTKRTVRENQSNLNEEIYDTVRDVKSAIGTGNTKSEIEDYLGYELSYELEKALKSAGVIRGGFRESDESNETKYGIEDVMEADEEEGEEEEIDFSPEDETEEDFSTEDTSEIQDHLEAAIEIAKQEGDEKLVTQIGNTIVYLNRSQYTSVTEVDEFGNPFNMSDIDGIDDLENEREEWYKTTAGLMDYIRDNGIDPSEAMEEIGQEFGINFEFGAGESRM